MRGIPFITVEGPIGVGKTSLAQAIADHFQYVLLKEIVEENPFLGKFYENIEEWSFQMEMYFLCNRYKQLREIKDQYLLKEKAVVADYHIMKNVIFAKRTLHADEYDKYINIYHILTENMPQPNVVIYLDASLDTLLQRIKVRGRDIEKNMSPLYMEQLSLDYDQAMKAFEEQHPHIPVIRFSGDDFDFVNNKQDLSHILSTIAKHLTKGVGNHESSRKI